MVRQVAVKNTKRIPNGLLIMRNVSVNYVRSKKKKKERERERREHARENVVPDLNRYGCCC